jgi:hypothetical protein
MRWWTLRVLALVLAVTIIGLSAWLSGEQASWKKAIRGDAMNAAGK